METSFEWAKRHPYTTSLVAGCTIIGVTVGYAYKVLRDGGMIRGEAQGPMKGITVIDFTNVLAG